MSSKLSSRLFIAVLLLAPLCFLETAHADPLQDARLRYQAGSPNEAALYAYDGCKQNVKIRCLQAAVYFVIDQQEALATQMIDLSGGVRADASFSVELQALAMAGQMGAITKISPTLVRIAEQLGSGAFLVNLMTGALASVSTIDDGVLNVLARLCTDSNSEMRQTLKNILGSMGPDVADRVSPVVMQGKACSWALPKVRLHRAPLGAVVSIAGKRVPTQVEGEDVVVQVPLGANLLTIEKNGRIPFELEYRSVLANEVRADVRMDKLPPAWTNVATYGGIGLAGAGALMLLSGAITAEEARNQYLDQGSVTLSALDYQAINDAQSSSDSMSGLGLASISLGISSIVFGLIYGSFNDLTAPEWR